MKVNKITRLITKVTLFQIIFRDQHVHSEPAEQVVKTAVAAVYNISPSNYPTGCPPQLYGWTESSIPTEAMILGPPSPRGPLDRSILCYHCRVPPLFLLRRPC